MTGLGRLIRRSDTAGRAADVPVLSAAELDELEAELAALEAAETAGDRAAIAAAEARVRALWGDRQACQGVKQQPKR